jgi:hypothetical protein
MNKLPRNRLDDALNAILIVVGVAAVLTLAVGTPRHDKALAQSPAVQVAAQAAAAQAAPATKVARARDEDAR